MGYFHFQQESTARHMRELQRKLAKSKSSSFSGFSEVCAAAITFLGLSDLPDIISLGSLSLISPLHTLPSHSFGFTRLSEWSEADVRETAALVLSSSSLK